MSERTFTTIFGPVTSRRFGRSLGVDIIPRKLCTLDCIYCEVGRTDKRGFARKEYIPRETVLRELTDALSVHTDLDCITFSGSGEPTLHSGLGKLLQATHNITNLPVTVLTNGTLLWHDDVLTDLLYADIVSPSLNAVSEDIFRRINRPHPVLTASLVLEGLIAFRKAFRGEYFLEILFVAGLNDSDDEVELLRRACLEIVPDRIHVNTVVRPPAESWARPVPSDRLREICAILGPKAEVLVHHEAVCAPKTGSINGDDILSLLDRRAMSLLEIAQCLSADILDVERELGSLMSDGVVHALDHGGNEYFAVSREEQHS